MTPVDKRVSRYAYPVEETVEEIDLVPISSDEKEDLIYALRSRGKLCRRGQ